MLGSSNFRLSVPHLDLLVDKFPALLVAPQNFEANASVNIVIHLAQAIEVRHPSGKVPPFFFLAEVKNLICFSPIFPFGFYW